MAFYRSPVNPHNPVIVWTDGNTLFFAASAEQVQADRAPIEGETEFSPPPGYQPLRLLSDQNEAGLDPEVEAPEGGALLVATESELTGDELFVTISNTLEQKTAGILDEDISMSTHVSAQGAQFMESPQSRVSVPLSGALNQGEIHDVIFPKGWMRWSAPGGSHNVYLGKEAQPSLRLVERATGSIEMFVPAPLLLAIHPMPWGGIFLDLASSPQGKTILIDLRNAPPTVTPTPGDPSPTDDEDYAASKARLLALDIGIIESATRLRAVEMDGVFEALTAGGNIGLEALIEYREQFGLWRDDLILLVKKGIGQEDGRGIVPDPHVGKEDESKLDEGDESSEKKEGPLSPAPGTAHDRIPKLSIFESFKSSDEDRLATVRHEITHVIMGALTYLRDARPDSKQRRIRERRAERLGNRATDLQERQLIRAGEEGAGQSVPEADSEEKWKSRIEKEPVLGAVWIALLHEFPFIDDPEGTGEHRGVSLADESRYTGASDIAVGHPADSLGEFVASFTTSAVLYREPFIQAVKQARRVGDAQSGAKLQRLYRKAWRLIDRDYIPLGRNPF